MKILNLDIEEVVKTTCDTRNHVPVSKIVCDISNICEAAKSGNGHVNVNSEGIYCEEIQEILKKKGFVVKCENWFKTSTEQEHIRVSWEHMIHKRGLVSSIKF